MGRSRVDMVTGLKRMVKFSLRIDENDIINDDE